MKHILNSLTLRTLYNSLLYPHLNYGILLWGHACKSYLNQVVSLQKKALRLLSTQERLGSVNSFCKNYNMLKFDDLFNVNLGKVMYMQITEISRVTLPINLLPSNAVHGYKTRQSAQLHSQFGCTANAARSFLFMGPKLWNTLPDHVINSNNQNLFVQQFKEY